MAALRAASDAAEFSAFWWVTMVYFVVDFAWILLEPRCVKSPAVLLTHHVVAASYMFLPFFYPFTAPKMSYVMTVEVCPSGGPHEHSRLT